MKSSRTSSKTFGFFPDENMTPLAIVHYSVHAPQSCWCEHECDCEVEPSDLHLFVVSVLNSKFVPQDCVYYVHYLSTTYNVHYDLYDLVNADTVYTSTFSVYSGAEQYTPEMNLLQSALLDGLQIIFSEFNVGAPSSYLGALTSIIEKLAGYITESTEKKPNAHVRRRKKADRV